MFILVCGMRKRCTSFNNYISYTILMYPGYIFRKRKNFRVKMVNEMRSGTHRALYRSFSGLFSHPSIAQLVERWTVVGIASQKSIGRWFKSGSKESYFFFFFFLYNCYWFDFSHNFYSFNNFYNFFI